MTGEFLEINDFELYTVEWEGERGPIIGIHGLTSNYANLKALAEDLTPDYEVITYDLRGRGKSSPADGDTSIHRHAEDLRALMDTTGIESPFLLAHSMGAYVATVAASQYPDIAGLVLLDGGVRTPEWMMNGVINPIIERLNDTYQSEDEYIQNAKARFSSLGMEWNEYIEESVRHGIEENSDGTVSPRGDPEKVSRDAESVHEFDPREYWEKIKCPALLIRSTEEVGNQPLFRKEPFEEVQGLASAAEYTEVEANHYTMAFERQPELAKTIKKFLDKIKNQ